MHWLNWFLDHFFLDWHEEKLGTKMFPSIVNCISSLVLVSVNEMVCVSDIWTYLFGIRSLVSFLNFEENLDSVFLTICTPLPSLFFFIQSPAIMIISRFWGKIQPYVFFLDLSHFYWKLKFWQEWLKTLLDKITTMFIVLGKMPPGNMPSRKLPPVKLTFGKSPLGKLTQKVAPGKLPGTFRCF